MRHFLPKNEGEYRSKYLSVLNRKFMNTEQDFIPQECKRIRAIQEGEHLTMSEFAKEIGKSAATVTNIFKGRNKPTIDLLQSILDRFRVINPEWLLMGVGPMYRQKGSPTEQLLLDIRPEEPENAQKPNRLRKWSNGLSRRKSKRLWCSMRMVPLKNSQKANLKINNFSSLLRLPSCSLFCIIYFVLYVSFSLPLLCVSYYYF